MLKCEVYSSNLGIEDDLEKNEFRM